MYTNRLLKTKSGHCAVDVGGAVYSITEVTAMFLNHLSLMCEVHFGEPVDMAVVSVPAHFNAVPLLFPPRDILWFDHVLPGSFSPPLLS